MSLCFSDEHNRKLQKGQKRILIIVAIIVIINSKNYERFIWIVLNCSRL